MYQKFPLDKRIMFNPIQTDKALYLLKLKAFADDKNEYVSRFRFCFWKGRKHGWKMRKYWLPAIFPSAVMFSKIFFSIVVKTLDCVVKS